MDLEGTRFSEINQRKTNIVWSHLYVKSKTQQNEYNKERFTDVEQNIGC